jgi:hypothetical protein
MLIIRNSVFNHVADYAGQFDLWAYDDARVIIENSTLNASVYMSWHFYGRSILQMTNVTVGDRNDYQTIIWNGFQEHARGTFEHVSRAYCTGADGSTILHDQTWTTGNSRLRLVETVTAPWSPLIEGDNRLIHQRRRRNVGDGGGDQHAGSVHRLSDERDRRGHRRHPGGRHPDRGRRHRRRRRHGSS